MKIIRLTENDIHNIIKQVIRETIGDDDWNQAWEEYDKMNQDTMPDDESYLDDIIQSQGLDSPYGSAYCHSYYKGDYDPMVRCVRGNTLRDILNQEQ